MADNQPVKQHPQRGQMLLHRGLGLRPLQFLDIGSDVNGLYRTEIE
jgi:hypothetical protein